MAVALPPPTWKAFAVFLIFPLHIVLGVLSVPVSLYLLLVVADVQRAQPQILQSIALLAASTLSNEAAALECARIILSSTWLWAGVHNGGFGP